MTDILERLEQAAETPKKFSAGVLPTRALYGEAAEEIRRLRQTARPVHGNDPALDRQRRDQLEGLAIGLEQRGEKSAAHTVRLAVADLDGLRKALYELLYVSFPPSGADVPELVAKHHEVVRSGCLLLGIDPDGLNAAAPRL